MPSIHPLYEYDIFISYRQNDNRSDKWVSNFVNALSEELTATVKNPVSIYFDENPHDGLLETHQVDASLAKKLKCMVFIPIISQTYCDESCFAWEHEFLPFVEMAKKDELGMYITLSNGNVTSRVLPIKIHELDTEDQNILEGVLDGPLRSIDFIYKEPGVNRPLNADDSDEKNLNKTRYKNQINKVANSLKDISTSIINQADGEISLPTTKTGRPPEIKSTKKGVYVGLSIVIIALISFWSYSQFFNAPKTEAKAVTIAVLSFDYQSSDDDQEWLGNGFPGAIRDVLNNVNGLQVIGKASSQSFKGKNATIKEIGETLNVQTILEGSVSKVGKKLRITVQLTDVDTELQIWHKKFDRDWGDIYSIMDEVAQSIVSELKGELSIEDLGDITVAYDVDPEAYEYYLIGENFNYNKFWHSRNDYDFRQSEKMYLMAIAIDSTYAEAYAGLVGLYYQKIWATQETRNKYDRKVDSLVNIAYSINPNSAYVFKAKGESFIKLENRNVDSAYYYFKKARNLEPNNFIYSIPIIGSLNHLGLFENSISLCKSLLMRDPLNFIIRVELAQSLVRLGKDKEAREQFLKIIEFDPTNVSANEDLVYIVLSTDNDISEAKRVYQLLERINPNANKRQEAWILAAEGKREEALNTYKDTRLYSLLKMKKETIALIDSLCSFDVGDGRYCSYLNLRNSNIVAFIRDEPKFKEMLAKAKVVYEERVAKYGHYFDEK